jgi:hypothetical protein
LNIFQFIAEQIAEKCHNGKLNDASIDILE